MDHKATAAVNAQLKRPIPQDDAAAPLGISFAGGGWLMCYLFGVATSLRRNGLHHTTRFTGTSAGALAAIGLTLDADFDAITHTVTSSYVPQAHGTVAGPFQMRHYLIDALTRHANLDRYDTCNNDPLKCTIVYTSLSAWMPRRKSTFASSAQLLDTLIASCCATPLVGLPFRFQGEWVIDGGLTENQPRFQHYHNVQRVVNVSPNVMDTHADIRPSQYVPPWWSMFPPSAEELQWVYRLGQKDGHDWCVREGYASSDGDVSVTAPERPPVHHTGLGQMVGYQWVDALVLTVVSCWGLSWDVSAVLPLLQLELVVRRAFQACRGVGDSVLLLWALTILSMRMVPTSDSLQLQLYLCGISASTVLGGLFLVSRAFQRLNETPEWRDTECALNALERHAPTCDFLMLSQQSQSIGKDDHARLATLSLVYSIANAHVRRKTWSTRI